MMIEKEYYGLEDLKTRFHLTESDIKYLITEKGLQLCFYVQNTNFIIGGWRKTDFVGYANVSYEGIIGLAQQHARDIAVKSKVMPNHFKLLNKAKIKLIDTKYNFDLEYPNNYIQDWQPKAPDEITWSAIPAKLYPYVAPTIKNTFKNFWMSLVKDEVEKTNSEKLFNESFGVSEENELRPTFKTFSFADLCVHHEELVSAGIIKNPDVSVQVKPTNDSNTVKLDNEFEDLLATIILQTSQKLTAKKIHRVLCDECEREEDSRLFDKNNILLSEDQGVITWRDKYRNNKNRTYSQSSLDNIISQVRLKLSLHKHSI